MTHHAKPAHNMSQTEHYTPDTSAISAVELPQDLHDAVELTARNIHEVWAENRLSDGWRYGPERDDKLRLTPCLVPYDALPERERDYDRATAATTIKALLAMGYKIIPPEK